MNGKELTWFLGLLYKLDLYAGPSPGITHHMALADGDWSFTFDPEFWQAYRMR